MEDACATGLEVLYLDLVHRKEKRHELGDHTDQGQVHHPLDLRGSEESDRTRDVNRRDVPRDVTAAGEHEYLGSAAGSARGSAGLTFVRTARRNDTERLTEPWEASATLREHSLRDTVLVRRR